ncbi:MAG: CDP-alcohol phosphatidyltransferase family protein [bacterium]
MLYGADGLELVEREMNKEKLKQAFRDRLRPIVLSLDRAGFTPLSISVIGLVICLFSGLIVAEGYLFLGALVFLLGSVFDLLDGDLARLQKKVSRRGAFLDSCFDRLGEAGLFAGLTWYYMEVLFPARPWAVLFIFATLVGSLTTSYVRARAEGVGTTCYVGLMQRPERIALLGLGMLLGSWILEIVLAFLAVVTLATTVQRLLHVARKLPGADDSSAVAASSGAAAAETGGTPLTEPFVPAQPSPADPDEGATP